MAVETGILLESGTNELELLEFVVGNQILEFVVDGHNYGINVAKINELCPYQEPTMVPNAHEYIEGIFMPRERLITVIDLAKALGVQPSADTSHDMYIITNFNRLHTAFHVQQVLGIHRVSWKDIAKPDSTISGNGKGVATGITKINGRIIIVLDFEKIVTEVNPETGLKLSEIELVKLVIKDTPVLLLDDVLSELDSNRQNFLINSIGDIQTIVTCTGLEEFINNRMNINKIFKVTDGHVVNEN